MIINSFINQMKTIVKFKPVPKTPLGRWCHKEYIESCCSKVQDRKAELANIDNSYDIRKEYKTLNKTNISLPIPNTLQKL